MIVQVWKSAQDNFKRKSQTKITGSEKGPYLMTLSLLKPKGRTARTMTALHKQEAFEKNLSGQGQDTKPSKGSISYF